MKHIAISAILVVLAAPVAQAGPHIKTLADSCGICHGTDGKPPKDGLDRLAGMSKSEFIDEMFDLKQDPTKGRLMSVIARGYSNAEIRAMADYFSKLK